MLSTAAVNEIINGLWLSTTTLMAETNRLKKHARSQRDYDVLIQERLTPRLVGLSEVIESLPDSVEAQSATRLAAIKQAMTQLKADEHRQLDVSEMQKRNQDREEGRISRHWRF